jgi:hypothetical protein
MSVANSRSDAPSSAVNPASENPPGASLGLPVSGNATGSGSSSGASTASTGLAQGTSPPQVTRRTRWSNVSAM